MESQPPKAEPHRWLALGAINLGNFVTPLDTGIMALILPTIASSMRAPISVVLWVPLTSLLLQASFMPAFGRLSDRGGRKKYFLVGLVLFAIGAFLAGGSLTIYELLLYRVIQSLGAAFVLATGRAMIADVFGPRQRGFALGTNVSTLYVAITIGTVVAATVVSLTNVVGWRYVFYVSGAIAAIDVPVCAVVLKESPKNSQRKMDWPGALLFGVALGSALTLLTQGSQNALGNIDIFVQELRIPLLNIYYYPNLLISIPLVAVAAVGGVSTVLFIVREVLYRAPLIDFGLFRRNRMFLSTNLSVLFIYVSHWSTLTLFSFYLEEIRGLSVFTSGLLLTAEPLSVMVAATIGGWLASKTGSRDPSIVGAAIATAAMGLMATLTPYTSILAIAFQLAMLGIGVGIFAPGNTNAGIGSVEPSERGMANGVLGMMRFTGQSLSLAIGTLLVGYVVLGSCLTQGCAFTPSQYTGALQATFEIGFGFGVLSVLAAFLGREAARGSEAA